MRRFSDRIPHILLAVYVLLFVWGAIGPYDRAVWWAENIPIVLVVLTLVLLYLRGVRFSPLAYILMSILPYLHTIGGHYTFERVPFDWFNRSFGFERNMYDRIGHFSVGFYAFGIAEYLIVRKRLCSTSRFAAGRPRQHRSLRSRPTPDSFGVECLSPE